MRRLRIDSVKRKGRKKEGICSFCKQPLDDHPKPRLGEIQQDVCIRLQHKLLKEMREDIEYLRSEIDYPRTVSVAPKLVICPTSSTATSATTEIYIDQVSW